ncbi:sugar ABC transporter permease [Paenibacillus dendritiformis]|uniref:Binding-protein-dependent transport systems inner membrane component n=1 Tax=Paenibacillus dendritiformis C454 TaxID=1131935 RepID=H3SCL4_9BACL|nr:sugar ABC transporter permease [Paenibacillus dendritiformis]EHQ63117.1 binding-protein-dependent transport systems inner membrane component [Paenibacillus dendritiformis C454]PZM67571.1 sugar ABC transporter permease [Paenibacillus dendritiformis]TDL57071.1 sugar ABC transporter permease [Paenibacillus dendritiformis]WGU95101.1 sugar ABC transporter permease [Paenibacillus dendritiformis]CAH8771881.1 sugar ABC transporter permease [Paenibacillus dendritiformis]
MKGDRKYIVMFLLPAAVFMSVFLYYPFFKSVYLSFYRTSGFFDKKFVGWDNYKRLFTDELLGAATLHTLELMIYVILFQVGIALVLAVLVDNIQKLKGFYRTVFFFPVVISGTAISLLFVLFYNYNFGLLNNLLANFGIEKILWLDENNALKAVAIPTVWHYIGFYFVLFLTAMSKIPSDYYEAAKLEGISGIRKTTMLTIPLIMSDIKVVITLAITGTLKVFEFVWVITKGQNGTEVLGTYMYKKAMVDQNFGYGSTIAIYMVVFGVLLALIANRLLKRDEITY